MEVVGEQLGGGKRRCANVDHRVSMLHRQEKKEEKKEKKKSETKKNSKMHKASVPKT